jgi:GT2 family glycosyltransferase
VFLKRFMNAPSNRLVSSLKREIKIIRTSVLFDPVWYITTQADLRGRKLDAVSHYVEYGASERRDPHPLFDAEWYFASAKIEHLKVNPVVDYLRKHSSQKLSPHPLFDVEWYFSQLPLSQRQGIDALSHYLRHGWRLDLSPHPLFDPRRYRQVEPAASGVNPLLHYLLTESSWRKSTHSEFDPDAYVKAHPNAARACMPPLEHYLRCRQSVERAQARARREQARRRAISDYETKELVSKSGFFDADWYRSTHKDLKHMNMEPLEHFVKHGDAEVRSPGPRFDSRWYLEEYLDARESGLSPFVHFLKIGRDKGYTTSGSRYKTRMLPQLEVIVCAGDSTTGALEETLSTLKSQIYQNWRATIIVGYEVPADFERALLLAESDSKFSIVRRGHADDANLHEDFSVIVGGGVALREHALYLLASKAADHSECHLVYSDEDRLEKNGDRTNPIFKPGYSPTLADQVSYFGRCVMVGNIGQSGFDLRRALFLGRMSLDEALEEFLAKLPAKRVEHVPLVLYHDNSQRTKTVKPIAWLEEATALPSFTIMICTKNRVELLKPCIESIETKTDYPSDKIEILVVDNGSDETDTLEYLEAISAHKRAQILREPGPFNFSKLNNVAATHAANDVLLFVNNDTVVEDSAWLKRIGTFVVRSDVGAVGGKLLYPDGTIQHGGAILGIQGVAAHALVGYEATDSDARLDMTREMSCVTGACLAIRRELFLKLGGFDPVAAVAFNDTLLCLGALKAGYRNIYIKEPLMIHYESKSRGYDDKPERVALFRREAAYARKQHNTYFADDPYYNPNLSLQKPDELAFPPRRSKPWRAAKADRSRLKILFLSSTHEVGHGVPVVINLQAAYLRDRGHEVFIGGPEGRREMPYDGCHRVFLSEPGRAAAYAVEHGIDCIVVETPPFFSVVRWLADWPRTLFFDHGEPPAELFLDAEDRRLTAGEKRFCAVSASGYFAISESVKAESGVERAQIIPNGNSHLVLWERRLEATRKATRERLGWSDKVVVLNVCRFSAAERRYKGLDKYAEVSQEFRFERPREAAQTVFVVCGKGEQDDVLEMKKAGLEVFANVADSEMIELYAAADIYANFSRWEGYNLGIGQALAMGLPVVASDIPAHQAFSIFTSNTTMPIVARLGELANEVIKSGFSNARTPIVSPWEPSLAKLEQAIVDLCRLTDEKRRNALRSDDHVAEKENAF